MFPSDLHPLIYGNDCRVALNVLCTHYLELMSVTYVNVRLCVTEFITTMSIKKDIARISVLDFNYILVNFGENLHCRRSYKPIYQLDLPSTHSGSPPTHSASHQQVQLPSNHLSLPSTHFACQQPIRHQPARLASSGRREPARPSTSYPPGLTPIYPDFHPPRAEFAADPHDLTRHSACHDVGSRSLPPTHPACRSFERGFPPNRRICHRPALLAADPPGTPVALR